MSGKPSKLACAKSDTASLGAGASITLVTDAIITHWVASQLCLFETRDIGGTWRQVTSPDGGAIDNTANQGVPAGLATEDDAHNRIRNTAGVACSIRYFYWKVT